MVTFRTVKSADLSEISQLGIESKASWGYNATEMEIFSRELTLDQTSLDTLLTAEVACEGDEIIGYYTIRQHADGTDELEHLFVTPKRFSQGVGKELLERAIKTASTSGLQKLTILADPNSAKFYEKFGAVKVGDHQSSVAGRTIPIYTIEASA